MEIINTLIKILNVLDCKREFDADHPTPKPIELLSKPINYSSKENDIILDVFIGSGSTMVAAHQLNRKCYGMEIDSKYCQVIIDRMLKLDNTLEIKKNGQPYLKEMAAAWNMTKTDAHKKAMVEALEKVARYCVNSL